MNHQKTNAPFAEQVAIDALFFIANDPELLPRFLHLTGIDVKNLRSAAQSPGFLAGVLQFFLDHEPSLLAFTQASPYSPQDVQKALWQLPGGEPTAWG
ncbi:DUF3572 domain-containing protein [Bartonella sp. DGB2]|uniref:DUF3572 domain-containing protein n=1 Tax=Bartonella sp. DGB2 TaxID=3388426 RepID=UPI00398FED92